MTTRRKSTVAVQTNNEEVTTNVEAASSKTTRPSENRTKFYILFFLSFLFGALAVIIPHRFLSCAFIRRSSFLSPLAPYLKLDYCSKKSDDANSPISNQSETSINYDGKLIVHGAGFCIKKATSGSSHECGEDAFSLEISPSMPSSGRSFFGVADGVGGWSESGGDSSKVSNGILQQLKTLISSTSLSLSDASQLAFAKLAAQSSHSRGSTTLCAAALDHATGMLNITNVGDSGAFLIRNNEIILKTKPGLEGFNAPHQIGFDHDGRPYGSVTQMETKYQIKVKPGDILVLVTDGVIDNIYEQELKSLVIHLLGNIDKKLISTSSATSEALQERVQSSSISLCWSSWARSKETRWKSPFAMSAISSGYTFSGGKQDDISAVLAIIQ